MSSPLLDYRRLQAIGDRYRPQLVILGVDMTDFSEDIRYQHMLDRRGLYDLYDRIPIALAFFQRLAPKTYQRLLAWSVGGMPVERFFITEAPLAETRRWFEPLVFNVGRIEDWCGRRGADFVLAILPRAYEYSARESPRNWEEHECGEHEYTRLGPYSCKPFRYFDELRPRVAYPVVSLLPDFERSEAFPLYLDDDPHWNAAGHRLAAETILKAVRPFLQRRLPP